MDMKQFPDIKASELEYRAKIVELIYCNDVGSLQKFLSEADERKTNDSHAIASARLKKEFAHIDQTNLSAIQHRAMELFHGHDEEMAAKYRGNK